MKCEVDHEVSVELAKVGHDLFERTVRQDGLRKAM
jgi:hypothetical protein